MILTKYLVNTVLRNQVIVLVVLFLVFFSQKFVRVLYLVVDSNLPIFLIFVFFGLSIPEVMKLILPISLFIAVLMTFNYLYINNEIIAMHSCGIGNGFIVRGILFLSGITTIFSLVNVLFLSPLCLRYQNQLMVRYQSDFGVVKLFARQFQFIKRIHSVFFVNNLYGQKFEGIFFVRVIPNNYCSIVVADRGYIEQSFDGIRWLVLSSGKYYFWNEDVFLYPNFFVNSFNKCKILINQSQHRLNSNSDNSVREMFINQLWFISRLEGRIELHWRLTLIFVVFVMVLIVFSLSLMRLNSSYLLNIFSSVILYLLFFLLQIFLRFYISKGYIGIIWIWVLNFFYLMIAVGLNFWDSVICRNIRWKLRLLYMNNRD